MPLVLAANLGLSFRDDPDEGVPLVACLTSLLLVCGDILLLAETKKNNKNKKFPSNRCVEFKICKSGTSRQKISFFGCANSVFPALKVMVG